MLQFSRFALHVSKTEVQSLTQSTLTRQLTQKNVRRPQKAHGLAQRERWKKQRRERDLDIVAKAHAMEETMKNRDLSARDIAMARLADTIFSKGHKHVATATNVSFVPDGNPSMPLVALAGRSQVGKTSLMRSLFRASREVGKSNRVLRRDGMNFFQVGQVFNIVDLPGFGGTSLPWSNVLQYASLIRNFARFQPGLKMIYYCLDVNYKHGLYVQDIDMLLFLSREIPNFTVVLTKGDQLNEKASNCFRLKDIREELVLSHIEHPVLVTSAFRMGGIDTLRFDMVSNCLHALPTERLTYTEAKKLSDRLLTQSEMAAIREVPMVPTLVDEMQQEWNKTLYLDQGNDSKETAPSAITSSPGAEKDSHSTSSRSAEDVEEDDFSMNRPCNDLLQKREKTALIPITNQENDKEKKIQKIKNQLSNSGWMNYVNETSPWRNPLLWPSNVVPTKNLKVNIMRCPGDEHNPYLYQAQFVVSRADMCFRRPNIGCRKSSRKGRYEPHHAMKSLMKAYTIPYFPEIVDVGMHPSPWMFLGSKEAYFERSGGRELGIRLSHYALDGIVNPLNDNPAPHDKALAHEIRQLEESKYASKGTTIAMLTPPE